MENWKVDQIYFDQTKSDSHRTIRPISLGQTQIFGSDFFSSILFWAHLCFRFRLPCDLMLYFFEGESMFCFMLILRPTLITSGIINLFFVKMKCHYFKIYSFVFVLGQAKYVRERRISRLPL